MSVLTASNLGQSFGGFHLFSNITVTIQRHAKIGLVGPNGIGKTSLLMILAGLREPTTGHVALTHGTSVGYLRQEAIEAFAERTNSLYAEMLTVFKEVLAQEQQLREMEEAMADGNVSDTLLNAYGELQERFEFAGGYDYDLRIERVLDGLGFKKHHYDLPLNHLSGGQKTRALLARLLLERPQLLILDEPTNHLDVDAIQWLENALTEWDGELLIVSHDRYFLDKVVNTIWDMNRAGVSAYRGNYSAYVKQREERLEYEQKVFEQEQERLLQELDYVKRNIARASTNGMAVGRLKRLSRDLTLIETYGVLGMRQQSKGLLELDLGRERSYSVADAERRIKALESPRQRFPRLNFRLNSLHRSGHKVLRTQDLTVGYPTMPLFTADDIELDRLDCAALIGSNGSGKTTLLKTLMGELKALKGAVQFGTSLRMAYFAQAQDTLTPENQVIDELLKQKEMPISEARRYLAQYLFRGEDVFKTVDKLSGGERGRLALALMALNGANLLLLDEPTNHLDIPAQEVLQEVLVQFDGTVILVTHDRYLVDRLATQIWDLQDGHLTVFKGSYQEYLTQQQPATNKGEKMMILPVNTHQTKLVGQLEAQISDLEARLSQLSEAIGATQSIDKIRSLGEEYAACQSELDQLMAEWTALVS